MPQEIVKPHQTSDVWVDKHVGAKIVGLSVHTLKKLRSEKAREADRLIEGVHFVRHGGYCVRYNAELLRDYAATRSNPEAQSCRSVSSLRSPATNLSVARHIQFNKSIC